ncbi:MAG: glycosyltransferase [Desulfovibrio sp.]|nr:glycosyltransferase [Desulfovibrio sp.]
MKFSLLVVTTDRLHPAERLFRSLTAQSYRDFEVLFVHGKAYSAEALALVRKYAEALNVRAVPSSTPALSCARNHALSLLNGDCIAFPDDDCVYCPDTLANIFTLFKAHSEVDVLLAAGQDLRADIEEKSKVKGRPEQARERTFPPMQEDDPRMQRETNDAGKSRVKGRPEQAQGRTLYSRESISNRVQGSDLRVVNRFSAFRRSETFLQFYRRRCVEAVGPFDETLGPGTGLPYGCGEDTDYVLRALAAGFGVYRAPSVVVLHPAALACDPPPARKVRAYAAGRMRLLRKHGLPPWFVLANIVWPLLCVPGECLRACRTVVHFRWGMFRARLSSCPGAAG